MVTTFLVCVRQGVGVPKTKRDHLFQLEYGWEHGGMGTVYSECVGVGDLRVEWIWMGDVWVWGGGGS